MYNLELTTFNQSTYWGSCKRALRVDYQFPYLYILTNDGLEMYVIGTSEIRPSIVLSVRNCVTKLVFLQNQSKHWYGTGDTFMYFNEFEIEGFIVPEFIVAEWDDNQKRLAVIQRNGSLITYVIINDEEFLPIHQMENIFKGGVVYIDSARMPQIVWKPDGSEFVVSVYDGEYWEFKKFSYKCSLLTRASWQMPNPIMFWCPLTNELGCADSSKEYVFLAVFQDHNLKRYTKYQLFGKNTIEDLRWSNTGTDVVVKQSDNDSYQLNIYCFKNNEFILKQSLRFPKGKKLINFNFKKEANVHILNVYTNEEAITYNFKERLCHNVDKFSDKPVVCAKINGRKLEILVYSGETDFFPHTNYFIESEYPINLISFHPRKPFLVMIDSTYRLLVVEYSKIDYNINSVHQLIHRYNVLSRIPLRIRHLCWRNHNEIVYYADVSYHDQVKRTLYVFNPFEEAGNRNVSRIALKTDNLTHISVTKNRNCLILQDGYKTILFDTKPILSEVYHEELIQVEGVWIDDTYHLFRLTNTGDLLLSTFQVISSVSSFIISKTLLIFILNDERIYLIPLKKELLRMPFWNVPFDWAVNKPIEKGSQLLFALPNSPYIVVLNQRENLELWALRDGCIKRVEYCIQTKFKKITY